MWYVTTDDRNWLIRNCVTGKQRTVGKISGWGTNHHDAAMKLAAQRNDALGVTPKRLVYTRVFGESPIIIDGQVAHDNL